MKILNEDVVLNNMVLLRYINSKGENDLSFLNNLNVDSVIDLIEFINPKLTRAKLESEINADMGFVSTLMSAISDSLNTGKKTKPQARGKAKH